jgi:hypothetical protein
MRKMRSTAPYAMRIPRPHHAVQAASYPEDEAATREKLEFRIHNGKRGGESAGSAVGGRQGASARRRHVRSSALATRSPFSQRR